MARHAGVEQAGTVRHTDLPAALATAEHLAHEAGRLQLRERATLTVHGWKAHANDLVSDVDLASERLIADGLRAAFPADGVLAEEGANSAGTSGRRWIIDPLDGTRNYVTGAGPWSVCIALQDGADTAAAVVAAVVHDPGARETFTALRGAGAALNGEPIRASGCARLAEAIVGFSFNPSLQAKRDLAQIISSPALGRRYPARPRSPAPGLPRRWPLRRRPAAAHQAVGHRGRAAHRRRGRRRAVWARRRPHPRAHPRRGPGAVARLLRPGSGRHPSSTLIKLFVTGRAHPTRRALLRWPSACSCRLG
jgi:myo-inositol-1(or 4)-monophosphatase